MGKNKPLEEYPEIMTATHISEYLHISRRRVYELFNLTPTNGGIPNIVIGASKRVRKETLVNWINQLEKMRA